MSKIIDSLRFKELIYGGVSYDREVVTLKYEALASVLASRRGHGPFVFLKARNNLATVISFLALRKLGAVCVLIDPLLKGIELREYRDLLQPWALINHDREEPCDVVEDDISYFSYDVNNQIDDDFLEDACCVMFSSAEDGVMKPVVITEDNIMQSISHGTLAFDEVDEKRTSCGLIPFYHVYGLVNGLIIPITTGGRVLVVDASDISKITSIVHEIHKHGVTNVYSVPIVFFLFSRVPDVFNLMSHVKSLGSGGYKLSRDVSDCFFSKTGKEIHEGYGLSETTAASIGHKVTEPANSDHLGRPVPVNQVRIVDDQGLDVPAGVTGEIWIKGANVTRGYYGFPRATASHIVNGWLRTGDLAHWDDQGHVYFDGLKKRMFNIAGKNVYPAEVERLVALNENVVNVTITAQPNGIFGDKLLGTVLLRDGSREQQKLFHDWCVEHITQFKLPRQWTFL